MSSWRRLSGFLVASAVALVVAHNLDFIAAFGPDAGTMMVLTGHGRAWTAAVAVVLTGGMAFVALASWRLYRLWAIAARLDHADGTANSGPEVLSRSLLGTWLRLLGSTAVLFVIQENIEHRYAGEAMPGLGVLASREYPYTTLVIAGVTLAVAVILTLYRRREAALIEQIAASLRPAYDRSIEADRVARPDRDRRPESLVGRRLAGRAPPVPIAR